MFNYEDNLYYGYIYYAKNKINGKGYIGQTVTSIEHRKGQHCSNIKNKKNHYPFYRAIKKYGSENFEWICLYEVKFKTRSELIKKLNELEIESIIKYNTNIKNGKGYNVDKGGNSNSYLMKPVDAYDLKGNYITSFDSISEAGNYYNISTSKISSLCKGKQYTIKNFDITFRYFGDEFGIINPFQTGRQYNVYQYNPVTGELLNIFNNVVEASKYIKNTVETKINIYPNIINALNEKKGLAFGYYWSKKDIFDFEKYLRYVEIDKYDIDGNYIDTYLTLTDALKSVSPDSKSISSIKKMCMGNTYNPIFGFVWRFRGDDFNLYPVNKNYKGRKVCVDKYSLQGELLDTYETIFDACDKNNIPRNLSTDICACCNKKRQYSFGFVWRYHGENFDPPKLPKNQRKINCYTLNNEYVATFNNAVECAKFANGEKYKKGQNNNVNICVSGKRPSMYGYRWFRADDPNQPDISKINISIELAV